MIITLGYKSITLTYLFLGVKAFAVGEIDGDREAKIECHIDL